MIAKLLLISLLSINSQSMAKNKSAANTAKNESRGNIAQNQQDNGEKRTKQDAELEELISQVVFNLSKSSFKKDSTPTKDPNGGTVKTVNGSTTIISLFDCTEIAGDYIHLMDVTEFRKDPEGMKTIIGPIIISTSPAMDKSLHLSREQILQRLKEYNIPVNNLVIVGAQQVLVIRTNASAHGDPTGGKETNSKEEKPKPEKSNPPLPKNDGIGQNHSGQDNSGQDNSGHDSIGQDNIGQDNIGRNNIGQDNIGQDSIGKYDSGQETKTDECAIKKNSPVLIVREGPLFRMEEWGSAKANGTIGNLIKVADHKGRTLLAKITHKNTVIPVEEQ